MARGKKQLKGVFSKALDNLLVVPKKSRKASNRANPEVAKPKPRKPRNETTPPTKTERLKEHLTSRDLDAARRELAGETVATKKSGVPWDHVDEVKNAQRGLDKRIKQLRGQMDNPKLSPEARAAAKKEFSEASQLLDHSKKFVP